MTDASPIAPGEHCPACDFLTGGAAPAPGVSLRHGLGCTHPLEGVSRRPDWQRVAILLEEAMRGEPAHCELVFVDEVLTEVPGLLPRAVSVRPTLQTPQGPVRPDFTVEAMGGRRVAVEIIGSHRDGRDTDLDVIEHAERLSLLEEDGWTVKHFTYRQVLRDPAWCAEQLAQLMPQASSREFWNELSSATDRKATVPPVRDSDYRGRHLKDSRAAS